jgi:tight adherence protein B
MSPTVLFCLLLVVSFGVLFSFFKPTSTEKAVRKQLKEIEGARHHYVGESTILREQKFSSNAWLDAQLRKVQAARALSGMVRQAGRDWPVGSILGASLGLAVVGYFASTLVAPLPLFQLAAAVALASLPFVYIIVLRELRFGKFDEKLVEAVDLMARGLRAGHSVSAVLEMVGNEVGDPVGSEFRAMCKEQSLGLPMREAMMHMLDRMPRGDLRFLTTAILLQKETGGNLAQILDKTAVVLRERARLRGQLKIYTAQGRVTGWILAFTPFILFGMISFFNPTYEGQLLTEPMGLHMVYVGLVLMVLGTLIIRKIMDIRV